MEDENRLVSERKKKLADLKEAGIVPYAYRYDKKDFAQGIQDKYAKLKNEQQTKDKVKTAGRLMSKRVMGKAAFAHLKDFTGQVQLFLRRDDLGEDYDLFKKLDLGDIIGVEGTVFKTKTGEVTINVTQFELLTKNLRPLPEKYHGLKDTEARYRQRYVDLIVNPESMKVFDVRQKTIQAIREYLMNDGFIEVDTPILQPIYGGASAKPFVTKHNALDMQMYLRISNEMYLKRLVVGGFERVFEFSPDFRNEGIDTSHNPEFLMVETMAAYWDYTDSMKYTEKILNYVVKKATGKEEVTYQGTKISFKLPFQRLTMIEAVNKHAGVDFSQIRDIDEARAAARKLKVEITDDMTIGHILAEICDEVVEAKLIQPTILTDYPAAVSPLAKRVKDNPDFVERFELIIAGREYANVYSELNDPQILWANWEAQEKLLSSGDEEAQRTDWDFIKAMEIGMPPTSGIGIGIDRLIMLLTDSTSIRDVIFFPTLRKED